MTTKTNTIERNDNSKSPKIDTPWSRALIAKSEWSDKVIYK